MVKTKHAVNGVFSGVWIELDDRKVYLAFRTKRHLIKNDSWGIDQSFLYRAKERGVEFVGVVTKRGKKFDVYLARLQDWFDDPYAFPHYTEVRQRAMPLNRFRIRPDLKIGHIHSAARIR